MPEAAVIDEATADAGGAKPEAEKPAERIISPRMRTEVQNVTQAVFRRRMNKATDLNADLPARKIFNSELFANLTKAEIEAKKKSGEDGYEFPGADGKVTKRKEKGIEGGQPVYITVEGKRGRLVTVVDCDENTLKCEYQVGEGKDAELRTANVPRQQIKEANLLAEREGILKGLTGDERAVAETYFQLIDPDATDLPEASEELSKKVGTVAERNAMFTTNVILDAADALYKGKPPAEVKEALSYLDGKTVLDRGDIEQAFKILGVSQDREWLGQQADQLLVEITQEKAKLDAAFRAGADTTMFQQRVGELNSHLALFTTADKLWQQQEASGKSPVDNYLDKAANGELDPRFIQEFRSGKFDSVLEGLFEQAEKSMSDAEKAEARTNLDRLKSGSWKTIKFGGILLALLTAIPVAAAVVAAGSAGKVGR